MNTNRSTVRTIEILHHIADSSRQLTITEISQALDIPKSTTHQIVQTLVGLKILESTSSKTFRLGIRFFEIALPAFSRMDLRREGQLILEKLSEETKETVFMAGYDGDQLVYLDQVMGASLLRLSVNPGSRAPLHSTGLGKAILAALPNDKMVELINWDEVQALTEFTILNQAQMEEDIAGTRKRGYSIDDRELQMDICCVAAPVIDSSNLPVAAISIASHPSRMNASKMERFGEMVQEAALNLSRRLGYQADKLFN
jgi:DNA-binding IclR family transcriptional regulator